MSPSFRDAAPADAEAIARLHVASWREAYAGIVPAAILENVDMADRIARWQDHLAGEGVSLIAEADGGPAGFIRAGAPPEPVVAEADGHIFALYVLGRHHRRGIGAGLLGRAARAWGARGGRALSVGVLTENTPARAFYEAMGARFVRSESYLWDGHFLPESIYVFEDLAGLSRLA